MTAKGRVDARAEMCARVIADLRLRLLDLTNRNRLLNFKFSERSRNHVRVVDHVPDVLHERLVEGRVLTFVSLPEPEENLPDERTDRFQMALEEARRSDEEYLAAVLSLLGSEDDASAAQRAERALADRVRAALGLPPRPRKDAIPPAEVARNLGIDPSYELPAKAGRPRKGREDDRLQTLLFPAPMDRKLGGIRDGAHTALSEVGVPISYVALGFLEWYESDASDRRLLAPLLLHPVSIDRVLIKQRYRYSIASTGDDEETNLTLRERLRRDFGIELPDLDEEDTPESYFAKVATAVRGMKRWAIRRYATVGLFAFGRLAMYHDLDPDRWAEDSLVTHATLLDLLAGGERGEAVFGEDYEVDVPAVAAKVPTLITDADSSQFSAIADVMDGRNLAIKGPPGTGKSQTITNVIAAALANRKSVLFVAEKMAALDVVKKRLDDAGLGHFCLELHSTKAQKRAVLDSLRARRELSPPSAPRLLADRLQEQVKCRDQLGRYSALLNSPVGRYGLTLQQHLWAYLLAGDRARAAELPAAVHRAVLDDAHRLNEAEVRSARSALADLGRFREEVLAAYDSVTAHPFHGVRSAALMRLEQGDLVRRLADWHGALEEAAALVLAQLGDETASVLSMAELDALVAACADLSSLEESETTRLLGHIADHEGLAEAVELLETVAAYRESLARLDQVIAADIDAIVPTELLSLHAEVARFGREGGNEARRLGDLVPLIAELKLASERAAQCDALTSALLAAAKLDHPATPEALRELLEVARIVRATSLDVLRARSPRLMADGAREIIEAAAAAARDIKASGQAISERMTLARASNPAEHRSHASALRGATFWSSIFSGKVRSARAVWRALRRDGRSASRAEMAHDLDDLATYLERLRAFNTDESLTELGGARFEGVATDFELLLGVCAFRERTAEALASFDGEANLARRLLFEGDLRVLDAVTTTPSEAATAEARAFLSSEWAGRFGTAQPFKNLEARLERLRTLAEEIRTRASTIGLRDDAELGKLDSIAHAAAQAHDARARIRSDELRGRALSADWLGDDTSALEAAVELARTVHRNELLGRVARWLLRSASGSPARVGDLAQGLRSALSRGESVRAEIVAAGHLDEGSFFGPAPSGEQLSVRARRLARAVQAERELAAWAEFDRAAEAVRTLGVSDVVGAYDAAGAPLRDLDVAFDLVFHGSVLRHAYRQQPELAKFTGLGLSAARRRFQELDREILQLQRAQLAADLAVRGVPRGNGVGPKREWTELSLVDNEIGKKKRHVPLRDLLFRAGAAIQALKPCWMMSPASVAQFLSQQGARFDLVVIDEASQMKPEEAVGAVARSGQLVVVGDPKQLPPSTFFERSELVDEEEDDQEDYVDAESILDMALTTFRPSRHLRWHYRSRHESLIAFSNRHFYDNSLVIFPAATSSADLGVEYRKIEGVYTPKAGVNLPEASAVAEAAIQFMRREAAPANGRSRSLGIVAVNQAQRDVLLEEIDRLCARESAADDYRKQWEETLEPFFVKNLENVQGDERDVIFISTVYGPDRATGKVAQRFGPINSATGHRRLNVLFTRAKEKVVVFSSMEPSDLLTADAIRPLGVEVMKNYLSYAKSGQLEVGQVTGRQPESDFEVFVADRLRAHGYNVVPQVGVGGYFIDMGVRHPNDPSRFVLGIECDGAAYHSAKSARDRDRLREESLSRLGWQLYRIWSTDWFNDEERETSKLIAHLAEKCAS